MDYSSWIYKLLRISYISMDYSIATPYLTEHSNLENKDKDINLF